MRATERAHHVVEAVIRPGETVVDATVGNGHDTLFLARCVGPGGLVIGFDVQEGALSRTRQRLTEAGIAQESVRLVHDGHEHMTSYVERPVVAVMFNLGYLPGDDHTLTTTLGTTVSALGQAFELLRPAGVLTVVCYRDHPGGSEEADGVCQWAERREAAEVEIFGRDESNRGPFLIVVRPNDRESGGGDRRDQ